MSEEKNVYDTNNDRLKIWYIEYDENGNEIGRGVYHKDYVYYGTAYRIAVNQYGHRHINNRFQWRICHRDPWKEYFEDHKCGLCGKTYKLRMSPEGYRQGTNFYLYSRQYPNMSRDKNGYINTTICEECKEKLMECVNSLREEKKDA